MTITAPPDWLLLDLAEAMRGREWRDSLPAALAAAKLATWDPLRTFSYVARLLVTESADPRDLTAAARKPTDRVPASAELTREGAAKARAALAEALGEGQ